MTPKEKAKELVTSMYKVHPKGYSHFTAFSAIRCAIIAVDEIINVIQGTSSNHDWLFWNEVKKELEKI